MTPYLVGFAASAAATVGAYALVVSHAFAPGLLLGAVIALALMQLSVQLVAFLHLGRRTSGPALAALVLAAIIVGIVVGGSLWIIQSLNARMMPTGQAMLEYMQAEAGSP